MIPHDEERNKRMIFILLLAVWVALLVWAS